MSDNTPKKPTLDDYKKLTEQELAELMNSIANSFKSQLYSDTYRYLYQPYPWRNCRHCGSVINLYGWCACRQYTYVPYRTYWKSWDMGWSTSETIIPKKDPDTSPPDVDTLLEDDEDEEDDDIPTGWLCPICKNVYAPSVKQCPEC